MRSHTSGRLRRWTVVVLSAMLAALHLVGAVLAGKTAHASAPEWPYNFTSARGTPDGPRPLASTSITISPQLVAVGSTVTYTATVNVKAAPSGAPITDVICVLTSDPNALFTSMAATVTDVNGVATPVTMKSYNGGQQGYLEWNGGTAPAGPFIVTATGKVTGGTPGQALGGQSNVHAFSTVPADWYPSTRTVFIGGGSGYVDHSFYFTSGGRGYGTWLAGLTLGGSGYAWTGDLQVYASSTTAGTSTHMDRIQTAYIRRAPLSTTYYPSRVLVPSSYDDPNAIYDTLLQYPYDPNTSTGDTWVPDGTTITVRRYFSGYSSTRKLYHHIDSGDIAPRTDVVASTRAWITGNPAMKVTPQTGSSTAPGPAVPPGITPVTYTVTNTGDQQLGALTLADPAASGITCQAATLAPGVSTTCQGTATVSSGSTLTLAPRATATPVFGSGAPAPPALTVTATSYIHAPGLTLRTTVNGDDAGNSGSRLSVPPGEPYTVTYYLTNTGQATLTEVTVTDRSHGTDTVVPGCPNSIPAGATLTCTKQESAPTGGAVSVDENTTATANDEGVAVSGQDTSYLVTGTIVGMTISATVNGTETPPYPGTPVAEGSAVNVVYTVKNTSNVVVTDLAAQIDNGSAPTCADTSLQPGQSTTCTATVTVTASNPLDRTTTVRGSADGTPVQVSKRVLAYVPTIGLSTEVKNPADGTWASVDSAPGTPVPAGAQLELRYVVRNTSPADLAMVTVTGTDAVGLSCPRTTLAAGGGELLCTARATASVDGGVTATYAGAVSAVPSGYNAPQAADSDTAVTTTVPVTSITTALLVDGTPIGNSTEVDPEATTRIEVMVTNTGNVPLSGVHVGADTSFLSSAGNTVTGTPTLTCQTTTLAAGASTRCVGELKAPFVPGTMTLTTRTGAEPQTPSGVEPPALSTVVDTGSFSVHAMPSVTIRTDVVTPSGPKPADDRPGEIFPRAARAGLLYVIRNTGNVPLTFTVSGAALPTGGVPDCGGATTLPAWTGSGAHPSVTCTADSEALQESQSVDAFGTVHAVYTPSAGQAVNVTSSDSAWITAAAEPLPGPITGPNPAPVPSPEPSLPSPSTGPSPSVPPAPSPTGTVTTSPDPVPSRLIVRPPSDAPTFEPRPDAVPDPVGPSVGPDPVSEPRPGPAPGPVPEFSPSSSGPSSPPSTDRPLAPPSAGPDDGSPDPRPTSPDGRYSSVSDGSARWSSGPGRGRMSGLPETGTSVALVSVAGGLLSGLGLLLLVVGRRRPE
ncbi:hypothetical protein SAMN05421595_0392 [Austwickia chelonae]|uniref:Gram-positive cocci surface proteins LPxTG domain-containing protein n=1 Tax=Austwickia chelonae NBRC 105200 TaxID=1184607 RepID=K6UM80_9MICO|nr:hypothetical protein [Austwickia chelonae]GAB77881.1 hypothetical protein AUCHE_08_01240 [Austwickia chelonae NBRC 105200]SEV91430.1 hypothetical protein SAMN05421595_0392 [Austwickia chelonae]